MGDTASIERRKEERYNVPPAAQDSLALKVKAGGQKVPALLANFSRSGILFESPVPFDAGHQTECTLAASFVVEREITFNIAVKYCYKNCNSYIIGASIDSISDGHWFDFFIEIHDYISTRAAS